MTELTPEATDDHHTKEANRAKHSRRRFGHRKRGNVFPGGADAQVVNNCRGRLDAIVAEEERLDLAASDVVETRRRRDHGRVRPFGASWDRVHIKFCDIIVRAASRAESI